MCTSLVVCLFQLLTKIVLGNSSRMILVLCFTSYICLWKCLYGFSLMPTNFSFVSVEGDTITGGDLYAVSLLDSSLI